MSGTADELPCTRTAATSVVPGGAGVPVGVALGVRLAVGGCVAETVGVGAPDALAAAPTESDDVGVPDGDTDTDAVPDGEGVGLAGDRLTAKRGTVPLALNSVPVHSESRLADSTAMPAPLLRVKVPSPMPKLVMRWKNTM